MTMTHAFDILGPRHTTRPQRLLVTLAAVAAALAGCGGGSGPSGNPGGDSSFTVSGTVSGLASGQQVSLVLNGNTAGAVVANANGSYTVGSLPANGSYAVTVGTQPAGQLCTVDHGSGSGVTANVSDVTVTCSNTGGSGTVAPHAGWTSVKMGGGGYIPGVLYHPTAPHLRYARTDVAGVYRWDHALSKWTGLTDSFGPEDGGNQGAESMAVDPNDANKVYMTTSQAVQWGNGRFYYSSNQGTTWKYVMLPFPVGSNNGGRAIGERLMADPNHPTTLFYATRTAGLWKSTDSGLHWSQVSSLSSKVLSSDEMKNANGGSPVGVEFVVFDTTVPTTGFTPSGTPTQTIYVGIAPDYKDLAGLSSYLYKSTDGGATWTGISIPAEVTTEIPAALHIPHLARAADGMLYVPFTAGSGPGSAGPSFLYRFDGGATWTQLTRTSNSQPGVGNYYGGIGGLSVHGSGATTKIAFGVSGTWGDGGWVQIAMASADAGATWHEIGRSGDSGGSRNYHDPGVEYWGWVDTLQIDPFDPNHVSYGIGGGIMSTTDAFSTPDWLPHWKFDVDGIEEMINLAMTAPPPTASYLLLSGQGDTGLYVNTSLTSSTGNRSPHLGGGNGTGIDMAWNNPDFIVGVGTFFTNGVGSSKGVYSTDSGLAWTEFESVPPTASTTGDHTKVAVTADGANIVWSVAGEVPYYSTDRGTTWKATNLPRPAAAYNAGYHIAADRKNPLKVYAYDHGGDFWNPPNSGRFYHSTDGGHTFTASAQTWAPFSFGNTDLAVNPFAEGDVWLADANNLWHSTDSGVTWKKLTGTEVGTGNTLHHGAKKVALGVPAAGSSYSAAVYFVGRLLTNGVYVYGVYRSDDEGTHWTRIDDDDHLYGGVGDIVADTKVYGRVFMAGRGMVYNY
jgi:hypothetical protein